MSGFRARAVAVLRQAESGQVHLAPSRHKMPARIVLPANKACWCLCGGFVITALAVNDGR
jgi:hypothetical protein